MMRGLLALLLATALVLPTLVVPSDAAKKRARKAVRHAPIATPPMYRQEPARMIEVRPGHWISSWGCYTDEGNGRIGSCDMREGPM
jgi:hypothetical protein